FLDVGCGLGMGLMYAQRFGFKLYATELDQDAIDFVNRELNAAVFHGDLLESNYADEQFDYIYMYHVIEHVLDPVKYVAEMNRILKPGGTLFIGTPNISSFIYRVYRAIKFLTWSVPGIVDGLEHTFLFNRKTLQQVCGNAGFKMVKHKKLALEESLSNILRSDLSLQKKVSRYVQTFFSTNQDVVFRKPL
ncbi:MAG: class I SAM-dependent methyltransferase, partial [Sphingobacteriales bacterium]